MSYNEELAAAVRAVLAGEPGITEKRMFGGLAFLVGGNMAVSASGQGGLLLRVDPARTDDLVAAPEAERAVMGGRETAGWLRVDTAALTDPELRRWIAEGLTFARTLPVR